VCHWHRRLLRGNAGLCAADTVFHPTFDEQDQADALPLIKITQNNKTSTKGICRDDLIRMIYKYVINQQ